MAGTPWVINDTKVTDFGSSYEDMQIPDATTPVKGTNDPAVPTTLSALDESARMFSLLASNIEYKHKRFVTENEIIEIANSTDLTAANTRFEQIGAISSGITVLVKITGSFSTSTSLTIRGYAGGGSIQIDGQSNTITKTGSTDGIVVGNCHYINIGSLTIQNNTTGRNSILIGNVEKADLTVNFTTSSGAPSAGLWCYDSNVKLDSCQFNSSGYGGHIVAQNSNIYTVASSFTGVPTVTLFSMSDSSMVIDKLEPSDIPTGSSAVSIPDSVTLDSSSSITATEYGTLSGTTHTVTFSDTGLTYLIPDIMRYFDIINSGKSTIDVELKLKLPANASAFTDVNSPFVIRNVRGKGQLTIEANTVQTGTTTSQDTKINGTASAGITIYNCNIPTYISSMWAQSSAVNEPGIKIEKSNNVITRYNYVLSNSGTPGNGIDVINSHTVHESDTAGVCVHGITNINASTTFVNACYGTSVNVTGYGVVAAGGSHLGTYFTSSADQITGASGTASSSSGGTVKEN